MILTITRLIAVVALLLFIAPLGAEAQPLIRVGASLSLTGLSVALGQNQLRGYQL